MSKSWPPRSLASICGRNRDFGVPFLRRFPLPLDCSNGRYGDETRMFMYFRAEPQPGECRQQRGSETSSASSRDAEAETGEAAACLHTPTGVPTSFRAGTILSVETRYHRDDLLDRRGTHG